MTKWKTEFLNRQTDTGEREREIEMEDTHKETLGYDGRMWGSQTQCVAWWK